MYRFDVNHPRPPDSRAARARGGGSERTLRCPLLRVRPSGCGSSHRWASGGSCSDGACSARGCFPSPPVQWSGTPRVGRRSLLCACWPGLNRAESIKKKKRYSQVPEKKRYSSVLLFYLSFWKAFDILYLKKFLLTDERGQFSLGPFPIISHDLGKMEVDGICFNFSQNWNVLFNLLMKKEM